ncbi:serine/threonine-protein kinase CHEK1 [Nematocida sp. LUAm3]|nr:serine/threonine-protein kinase CHEK1 [Nematocida sp. LUAm3]KAI5175988.1 serine/threonine-protein kinase CHEK1 [Nematocida sp. LUAm2]KAI5179084.1 serine/threonine-protein kinase CHEK1 [Nematocida sp. LUAm1]
MTTHAHTDTSAVTHNGTGNGTSNEMNGTGTICGTDVVIGDVIAYGAMSVVRKGETKSGKAFAVKIIRASDSEQVQAAKKEALIQKALVHPNILKLRDTYLYNGYSYLIMDYADKNELFSYIEPGKGLPEDISHMYIKQLLSALTYIHSRGICHRDIKPENILLDASYNLLLTDFGCSTVYKGKTGRRVLSKHCGSTSYIAPEIYLGEYDGESVDIWSFGVLSLVMWTGTIPWTNASVGDPSFDRFLIHSHKEFFREVPQKKLKILERTLSKDPRGRVTFQELLREPFISQPSNLLGADGLVKDAEAVANKLLPSEVLALSQPNLCVSPSGIISNSQPIFMSYNSPYPTRIYVNIPCTTAISLMCSTLDDVLIQYKVIDKTFSFNTVDGQKNTITGEILLRSTGAETLLIFQKTRGNCLEFKKMFNIVKENFIHSINTNHAT